MKANKIVLKKVILLRYGGFACYCYHNTAYRFCGIDGCHFCVINDFISQEFFKRRKLNVKCLINKGLNDCQFVDCTKDVELN